MTRFLFFDRDNRRAYYRGDTGGLYCLQDETDYDRPKFRFYRCSDDGEPSYAVLCGFADPAREFIDREAEDDA